MNEVLALQSYKFVLLKKKQMLVLKKKIKRNTCNNSTKKSKFIITAGENFEGLGETLGSYAAFSEPSITLSIPRPSSFTIPSSIPGAGTAFSGA